MSWPQILVIIVATAVPVYIMGLRRGFKRGIELSYGREVLQNSVRDAVKNSPDVPGSES